MAYRSPRKTSGKSSGRKFQFSKVLPIWGISQTDTVTMFFQMLMLKFGITDAKSYWHKLRTVIVISAFVCAVFGASNYGLKGFILGGLLGLAAPAAILWLGILLIGIAIFIAIYVAAWAVILWIAWWLLHS